jgi:WD40 repeat protein
VWDVATGQQVGTLDYPHRVNSIVFSPDGTCIASGSGDKAIRVCIAATGHQIGGKREKWMSSKVQFSNGWFRLEENPSYILWIPHAFRQCAFVWPPTSQIMVGQPKIFLQFNNAALGPDWGMMKI